MIAVLIDVIRRGIDQVLQSPTGTSFVHTHPLGGLQVQVAVTPIDELKVIVDSGHLSAVAWIPVTEMADA